MTNSESKFREYIKKRLGDKIYLKKLPDFKQTCNRSSGLPDYFCINKGKHIFFEVKQSKTKTTFNLNDISEVQYAEFDKIHNAGGRIYIAILLGGQFYIVPYLNVRFSKMACNMTSVNISALDEWREW